SLAIARRRLRRSSRQKTSEPRKELWKCRGYGKRGKPKTGFPLFPRAPWESRQRQARFPHSHSSDDEGGCKSGKPRAGFPLSHRPEFLFMKPGKQRAAGYRPLLRVVVVAREK